MSTVLSNLTRAVAMLLVAAFLVSPTGQQTTRLVVQNIVQVVSDNLLPVLTPPHPANHTPGSTSPKETS